MFRIDKNRQLDRKPLIPSKGHFYVTGYLSFPVSKGQPTEHIHNENRIRTPTVLQILKADDEFITFGTLNSIYTVSCLKVSTENRALCAQRYGNQKITLLKRKCP